jgi:hypothetical protein
MDKFANLDIAAHSGANGHNHKRASTAAQNEAGNYAKGRESLHGLRIAIESPRGTLRHWKAADGTSGSNLMKFHYGYIMGTLGNDGDELDCSIGPMPESPRVYVVNQFIGGKFDEHKIMLGFPDKRTAVAGYLSNYDPGWTGLGSCAACSITQLKWWIAHGNKTRPLTQDQLPNEGTDEMEKVLWDSANLPLHSTLEQVLYRLRAHDGDDGLLFDAVSMADILGDADGVLALDALVIPLARLEQRMTLLQKVLDRAGDAVKVASMQVSEPFTQRGSTNVAVIYELTDGQTVSVFFHNPDVTPRKIAPGDDVISWKWMLNKKDITVAVAPEKGRDLNVRTVAARLMMLAEKNSARFIAANGKRAERMETIASLKTELETKEATLADLEQQVAAAQASRDAAGLTDSDPLPQPDPALSLRAEIERQLPEGYALTSGDDTSAMIAIDGGYTATLEIRKPHEGADFTRLYANVSDGSKTEDAGSVPRPEERMQTAVRYSLENIADVVAVLEREDRPKAAALTDAEMVVLIATASFKSFARLQNAMSDAGIGEAEYTEAAAGLNAASKYLKRSAITPEGKAIVEAFRPDLGPGNANKLKAFKGKFVAEQEQEQEQEPEPTWRDKFYVQKNEAQGTWRVASVKNDNPISPAYLSEGDAENAASVYFATGEFPDPNAGELADRARMEEAAFAAGRSAFFDDQDRIAPADMAPWQQAQWLDGWDTANSAPPKTEHKDKLYSDAKAFYDGKPGWYGIVGRTDDLPDDYLPEVGSYVANELGELVKLVGYGYAFQINPSKEKPFRAIKALYADGRSAGSAWAATPAEAYAMIEGAVPITTVDPAAEKAAQEAATAEAAAKAAKEAQEAQESADGDFLAAAAAGNVDFYDKGVTDRLAALARTYTDPSGAFLDLVMQAKTAAKNFFVAEFKKKVA